jgi:predicted N-formylglutamate amidohydrolase
MTTDSTPAPPPFSLLAADEPHPAVVTCAEGASPFFLTCDHAGNRIPHMLGRLGVTESELTRHIAWDIGIAGVAERMSDVLDATVVAQVYSRLVIDCNRDPLVPSSIVEFSEATPVPGNMNLAAEERRARQREILEPYHAVIAAALDARVAERRLTAIVAMHSFTPVYNGTERPWHVGVLYNRDPTFAKIVLDLLMLEIDLVVGENEPYSVSETTDYTIPIHAERRGLPHVELEIRQDLIAAEEGQREWAGRLVRVLSAAWERFSA